MLSFSNNKIRIATVRLMKPPVCLLPERICRLGINSGLLPVWGLFLLLSVLFSTDLRAQTTLSGDHVIEGNLQVGAGETMGGLLVTGTTYLWSPLFVNGYGEIAGSLSVGLQVNAGSLIAPTAYLAGGDSISENVVAMSAGTAAGSYTTAMTSGTSVGDYSTAMGGGISFGQYSAAIAGGISSGSYSVAAGRDAWASSAYSFVVGRFNTMEIGDSSSVWVETGQLFVVGNGTGDSNDPPEIQNRDALVVYKNGNVKIPKRQGDILMGEFGNSD